jgi:hypothetical protein
MLTIHYLKGGNRISTTANATYTPNIGDKIMILGVLFKVKDKVYYIETNTLYIDIVNA